MSEARVLDCAGRALDLSVPHVMGIINLTPDSFSDGGRFNTVEAALRRALEMVSQGATILDLGAESTRPGALPVSEQEELDRVLPVLERLRAETDVVISLDTSTPAVISEGAVRGAGLVNDIRALSRPGAMEAAAGTAMAICLMHMQGEPGSMQRNPEYSDVVAEVGGFLAGRIAACEQAGIARQRLLLDPGFGFGKRLDHNLELLRHLEAFEAFGLPLLVGISRKSMLGEILGGVPVERRLHAGLAAAVLAVERGASIIRTHDVGPTVEALQVVKALEGDF